MPLKTKTGQYAARATPRRETLLENIEFTEDFKKAFDLMENSKRHLFITGKAGTGKSTLLQYFKQRTAKNIAVLAPTGIAAITVGGATIHSFFRFPPRLIGANEVRKVHGKTPLFKNLDAVVIDEISMVRADLLDGIDASLQLNRNQPGRPFGGVQMIFFGDLFQLPPVVNDAELGSYFREVYPGPYFFHSRALRELELEYLELQKIFRQADRGFTALLDKIRRNEVGESELAAINGRREARLPDHPPPIVLTTRNHIASAINLNRLGGLRAKEYAYAAEAFGKFENLDEKNLPVERNLRLKAGAQVMMVKNDPERRWVNGSMGVVKNLSKDAVEVWIDGEACEVEPVSWETNDYEYNRETKQIEPVPSGRFKQFPVKLAWAITIHKSQGQTFDNVIIDVGDGAFAHGQIYVALSRCRAFEGIRLEKPIRKADILADPDVCEYVRKLKKRRLENAPRNSF